MILMAIAYLVWNKQSTVRANSGLKGLSGIKRTGGMKKSPFRWLGFKLNYFLNWNNVYVSTENCQEKWLLKARVKLYSLHRWRRRREGKRILSQWEITWSLRLYQPEKLRCTNRNIVPLWNSIYSTRGGRWNLIESIVPFQQKQSRYHNGGYRKA